MNSNPSDGEAFYSLGLSLRFQHRETEAYEAFYKATWNAAWKSAAYHALAELDMAHGDWKTALRHLRLSLRSNMDDLNARNLSVIALRKLSRDAKADSLLRETRQLDALDIWSRHLESGEQPKDNQLRMDLALDYCRGGFWSEAANFLPALTWISQMALFPWCCTRSHGVISTAKKMNSPRPPATRPQQLRQDIAFPSGWRRSKS